MAVSDAQKRSAQKWDAANLDRVSIAMPKGMKDTVKAAAESAGESMNQYINGAITQRMNGSTLQDFAEWPQSNEKGVGDILTPRAEEIAQRAAEMAGETMPEFVERAIDTQAKRDKAAFVLERAKRKAPEDSGT